MNEIKRMQQIAGLLKESQIGEAKGDSKLNAIADLYAYRGIKSKYDDVAVERYGKNTVKIAEELAPRILAFMEEMKEVKNKIKNSSEGKMLELIVKNQLQYDGARRGATMVDIFNLVDNNITESKSDIKKEIKGNDYQMVSGIIDILKKVKDKDNRMEIANDMVAQFKREKIKFDYDNFLDTLK